MFPRAGGLPTGGEALRAAALCRLLRALGALNEDTPQRPCGLQGRPCTGAERGAKGGSQPDAMEAAALGRHRS